MRWFKMLHGMSICGAIMDIGGDLLTVYKDVEPIHIANLTNDNEDRSTDVLVCVQG
jgi:hypothetical protein